MSSPLCSCPAPKCACCGLGILSAEKHVKETLPDLKALKQLLKDALQPFGLDDICRNCQLICESYARRLGALKDELESFADKNGIIESLCDKVGLEDVVPLISLLNLFLTVREGSQAILKCKEVLESYSLSAREKHEELSQCVECTSPGTSPVIACGFKKPSLLSFKFICQDIAQNSPPLSPISPMLSSPTSMRPSAFLQLLEAVEVEPVPEMNQ